MRRQCGDHRGLTRQALQFPAPSLAAPRSATRPWAQAWTSAGSLSSRAGPTHLPPDRAAAAGLLTPVSAAERGHSKLHRTPTAQTAPTSCFRMAQGSVPGFTFPHRPRPLGKPSRSDGSTPGVGKRRPRAGCTPRSAGALGSPGPGDPAQTCTKCIANTRDPAALRPGTPTADTHTGSPGPAPVSPAPRRPGPRPSAPALPPRGAGPHARRDPSAASPAGTPARPRPPRGPAGTEGSARPAPRPRPAGHLLAARPPRPGPARAAPAGLTR